MEINYELCDDIMWMIGEQVEIIRDRDMAITREKMSQVIGHMDAINEKCYEYKIYDWLQVYPWYDIKNGNLGAIG
jgi:hypothetical protein